jgi:hypothetical protein
VKRPGTGLPPAMRPYVVGRTVRTTVSAGTVLALEMLDSGAGAGADTHR